MSSLNSDLPDCVTAAHAKNIQPTPASLLLDFQKMQISEPIIDFVLKSV